MNNNDILDELWEKCRCGEAWLHPTIQPGLLALDELDPKIDEEIIIVLDQMLKGTDE